MGAQAHQAPRISCVFGNERVLDDSQALIGRRQLVSWDVWGGRLRASAILIRGAFVEAERVAGLGHVRGGFFCPAFGATRVRRVCRVPVALASVLNPGCGAA